MFRDKLKKIMNKENEPEGNDKKKIENLVFFVVVLIITIVIINIIWNGKGNSNGQENNITSKQLASTNIKQNTIETEEMDSNDLEKKLETILSKIQGVGEVSVCINYSESSEVVAMYNENSTISTTEENDTSGGTRKIQENNSQKDIVLQEENGENVPITQKIVQPKIEGAIITAKGANRAEIRTNIIQAVEAVTGLATHKIQVFEMGK